MPHRNIGTRALPAGNGSQGAPLFVGRRRSMPLIPASGRRERMRRVLTGTACVAGVVSIIALSWAAFSDSLPPDASYRPLPTQPFSEVRAADEAEKPAVVGRQAEL